MYTNEVCCKFGQIWSMCKTVMDTENWVFTFNYRCKWDVNIWHRSKKVTPLPSWGKHKDHVHHYVYMYNWTKSWCFIHICIKKDGKDQVAWNSGCLCIQFKNMIHLASSNHCCTHGQLICKWKNTSTSLLPYMYLFLLPPLCFIVDANMWWIVADLSASWSCKQGHSHCCIIQYKNRSQRLLGFMRGIVACQFAYCTMLTHACSLNVGTRPTIP